MTTPPINKVVRGIRAKIAPGYLLGRISGGDGPVELITMKQAQAGGILPSTLPPSGPAGGDLGGTYPSPTVVAIQGTPVSATAPTAGQVLVASIAGGLHWVAQQLSYLGLSNLPPLTGGTTGQVLTKTSGVDYAFNWQTPSGGGGGSAVSSFWIDANGDYWVGLVDPDGLLVLDGSGFGVYVKDPSFNFTDTFALVAGSIRI